MDLVLKKSALALATLLGAFATQAQTEPTGQSSFEPWSTQPSTPVYIPAQVRPLTAAEKCRVLATFPLQKEHVFPKARQAFARTENLACRYRFVMGSTTPSFVEAYRIDFPEGVEALDKDFRKAEKDQENADRKDNKAARDNERQAREPRHERSPRPERASRSTDRQAPEAAGTPGKPGESIEQVRTRRMAP